MLHVAECPSIEAVMKIEGKSVFQTLDVFSRSELTALSQVMCQLTLMRMPDIAHCHKMATLAALARDNICHVANHPELSQATTQPGALKRPDMRSCSLLAQVPEAAMPPELSTLDDSCCFSRAAEHPCAAQHQMLYSMRGMSGIRQGASTNISDLPQLDQLLPKISNEQHMPQIKVCD